MSQAQNPLRILNGSSNWPQGEWSPGFAGCWRIPNVAKYDYIVGTNHVYRNAIESGTEFADFSGCCPSMGDDLLLARSDCSGVACYTRRREIAENWQNCTKNASTLFAIEIDHYSYNQILKEEAKASSAQGRMSTSMSAFAIWAVLSAAIASM